MLPGRPELLHEFLGTTLWVPAAVIDELLCFIVRSHWQLVRCKQGCSSEQGHGAHQGCLAARALHWMVHASKALLNPVAECSDAAMWAAHVLAHARRGRHT